MLGLWLGTMVGLTLGKRDGLALGMPEGDEVGLVLGRSLGAKLGDDEGKALGLVLGPALGEALGDCVGPFVDRRRPALASSSWTNPSTGVSPEEPTRISSPPVVCMRPPSDGRTSLDMSFAT